MTQDILPPEDTEELLRGLIAECADMVRTQLRPGMQAVDAPDIKWGYARTIGDLVKIAAQAGDTVSRLRGRCLETRHRVIVQRLLEERKGWE